MKALILLITSTLVIMADFIIAPILPKINEAFADTPNIDLLAMMVLTLPALFIVISSPLIGYLADKYGRKKLVFWGILVYVVSGVSGYFANSIYELLVGRAVFGVAITAVITGCSALISDNYKGIELSRMMGLQSAFIGYGGLSYLVLGGIMADLYWRNTFLVYLSPLLLMVLFKKYVDEPEIKDKMHSCLPIFDLKKYAKIYFGAFVLMVFFYMIPLQIPFYLKSIAPDVTNTAVAVTLACVSICSATISLFYKSIKSRVSYRNLFILPFALMGLGYITISIYPAYIFPVLGLMVAGIGMGLVIPNLRAWVGHISDICDTGRAFGGLTTCFYLGQVISPFLINTIQGSFTVAGILMIATTGIFMLVNRKKAHT